MNSVSAFNDSLRLTDDSIFIDLLKGLRPMENSLSEKILQFHGISCSRPVQESEWNDLLKRTKGHFQASRPSGIHSFQSNGINLYVHYSRKRPESELKSIHIEFDSRNINLADLLHLYNEQFDEFLRMLQRHQQG
jgi:hypothetical protein